MSRAVGRPWGPVIAMAAVGLVVIAIGSNAGTSDWEVGAGRSGSFSAPADGEDALVAQVIDGETIEVAGGGTVRLIGVAVPTDCFRSESLARMKQLLPPGTPVKLTYDFERTDAAGHKLAYVYRVEDGLFVNLSLAEDGFVRESIAAPNLNHVAELVTAAAEAEAARKGLWVACDSTTSVATTAPRSGPTTTTAARAGTSAPPVAAAPVGATTTSEACHPSYAGVCLPVDGPDVDCAGAGDGPIFVSGRDFGVVGPDVYGLDPDRDGIACET